MFSYGSKNYKFCFPFFFLVLSDEMTYYAFLCLFDFFFFFTNAGVF